MLEKFERIKLGHFPTPIEYLKNITKYLAKTDLYINSSLFEGFPNSVVEAIQHYIPVIASQSHGGINEILLNGKYGKIYSKGPDELAMYIKKFYINPNSFYNKINLSKKNSDKFNIDNHKKSFENLFKNF